MTEKIRYFRLKVLCDETLLHEEIAKVVSRHEDPKKTEITGIPMQMLETLYARDSMAPWSRVRIIREKINERAGILKRLAEEIMDPVEGARLYKDQQANRDHACDPRLFDDELRALGNMLL